MHDFKTILQAELRYLRSTFIYLFSSICTTSLELYEQLLLLSTFTRKLKAQRNEVLYSYGKKLLSDLNPRLLMSHLV